MKKLMVLLLMCSVLAGVTQAQDEHKFFDKTNIVLLSMSTGAMIGDLANTAEMVGSRYREVDPLWANLINHHGTAGVVVSGVASGF